IVTPFQWGHVGITAVWSLAGLVAVLVAIRRRSVVALTLSFGWLALLTAKVIAFDVPTLSDTRYGISLLIVAAAALLAGLARDLTAADGVTPEGAGAIVFSLIFLLA